MRGPGYLYATLLRTDPYPDAATFRMEDQTFMRRLGVALSP